MNYLVFLLATAISLNSMTTFNNSFYKADDSIVNMLEKQFIKNCNSEDLHETLENYLHNYFDNIDHISAHYTKEEKYYYYTVVGSHCNVDKICYLKASKKLIHNQSYFKMAQPLHKNTCTEGLKDQTHKAIKCYKKNCCLKEIPCIEVICFPTFC